MNVRVAMSVVVVCLAAACDASEDKSGTDSGEVSTTTDGGSGSEEGGGAGGSGDDGGDGEGTDDGEGDGGSGAGAGSGDGSGGDAGDDGESAHRFEDDALTGRAYILDLSSGEWTSPATIGPLITGSFTEFPILGVVGQSSSDLELVFGYRFSESHCVGIPAADFSTNPAFESPPTDVNFGLGYGDIIIEDFAIQGEFSEDGTTLEGGMTGLADIRGMIDLLAPIARSHDPDVICELLEDLEAPCGFCPDSQPYCLELAIEGITASEDRPLSCMATGSY